jgi:hypothetical protein
VALGIDYAGFADVAVGFTNVESPPYTGDIVEIRRMGCLGTLWTIIGYTIRS